DHAPGSDNHMLAAPFPAKLFTNVHVFAAADDNHADKVDGAFSEALLAVIAVAPVVELVEPVDDLAIGVVETRRPLAAGLLGLPHENAVRVRVLELKEPEAFRRPLDDGQVTGEIPEQVVLPGNPVRLTHRRPNCAAERGKVRTSAEERQDVLPFFQNSVSAQEIAEFQHLLARQMEIWNQ